MSCCVAVVGAGPAGLYAADALVRKAPGVRVDIIERLPSPFGLVRAGVAPDHQSTKSVTRVLGRIAGKPGVRLLGNVEPGRDVSVAELSRHYDGVVLAHGAALGRRLGIAGEDKTGVHGSLAFAGWYNGHPDFRDLDPDLETEAVAVIGNGNVAIDMARILAKTAAEMETSDIASHAARKLRASAIKDIHVIGRRGPEDARFTNPELAELGRLENAVPLADSGEIPDEPGKASDPDGPADTANLATLREFSQNRADPTQVRVRFHFHARPVEIVGADRVTGLRLERASAAGRRRRDRARTFDLACGLVVTCIGYRCRPLAGVPYDDSRGIVANHDGRVGPGLYVVGWAKRGPSGTIATNRPDSMEVVERLIADFRSEELGGKPGYEGLRPLLAERGVRPVSWDEWTRIDAAEIAAARASGGRAPRHKFASRADMLAVLDQTETP